MLHQLSQQQVLLHNNDKTIPESLKNFINSLNKACEDPDFRRFIEPFWPLNKFPGEIQTAEIQRQTSPSELGILLENSNTVLFSMNVKKLKFINISSECENIYGYTAGEFYNNYDLWKNVIHPDDMHIADLLTETLYKGRRMMSQYRVINKDGSVRWIESKFIPSLDNKGRLIKIDGISIDRTDSFTSQKKLRENEQRLIESEKKYRIIFENNPQPMWVLDNDSLKLLDVNAAATKHLGYSKDEFLSMTAYDLRTPDDRDRLLSLETKNRQNINNKGIWELLKKDGTISSVEITAELIDFEGKPARLILAHDITERINAERKLKLSNERYELVTRATNDAIWDWNLCKNELYWSEGYEKLFGYRNGEQEVNVHSWTSRIHPGDLQRVSNGLMKKINESDTDFWEDEYRYLKADGSVAFIYDRGFIIYENGIPVRMVGAMQDITGRKNIELEKERITSELLLRNKTLEQFAYIISHNLRSPVANITGLANIILSSPSMNKEDYDRCMEGLALSVKKLDDVIIDLNYILQVRRKSNEKKENINFTDLLADIKTSINSIITNAGIIITTDFTEAEEFRSIKSYLNSIFYNLIVNSIKYRDPEKQALIEISTRKKGDKLLLTFRDNGLGIDLNAHGSKIFGLYKKFHNHVEGKGMGLYMVKTQVEMLDGKIDVKSKINNGTEFAIEFGL